MNIYQIERPDNADYDEFDGVVLSAEDEQQARKMASEYLLGKKETFTVELLGTSVATEPKVHLTDFNNA